MFDKPNYPPMLFKLFSSTLRVSCSKKKCICKKINFFVYICNNFFTQVS